MTDIRTPYDEDRKQAEQLYKEGVYNLHEVDYMKACALGYRRGVADTEARYAELLAAAAIVHQLAVISANTPTWNNAIVVLGAAIRKNGEKP